MARSFFILSPGLPQPARFVFRPTPLLTQQDIWEAARVCQPSLLFRVRSVEGVPGQPLGGGDTLESCIGMVDAGTRWRCVFRMAAVALNGVHNPALSKVCSDVLQVISSQHPAGVAAALRRKMGDDIVAAASVEGVNGFEQRVAGGIAQLAQADNDIEAAHMVPFVEAFMPFKEGTEEDVARRATLEIVAGATLITEAAMRLAERAPYWMYAAMPERAQDEAKAPAGRGPTGVRQDDDEADDPPDGL